MRLLLDRIVTGNHAVERREQFDAREQFLRELARLVGDAGELSPP